MKHTSSRRPFVPALSLVTALAITAAWCPVVVAQDPLLADQTASSAVLRSVNEAKGSGLEAQAEKDCVTMTMSCNSTVMGVLDATDCELGDGSRIDYWEFEGAAGQDLTINMTAAEFDTWLFLFDPGLTVEESDDDSGTGTNSLIVFTLDEDGTWTIGANGFDATELGNYTLSLDCSAVTGLQISVQHLMDASDDFKDRLEIPLHIGAE